MSSEQSPSIHPTSAPNGDLSPAEMAKNERVFLHDLSNPLAIAKGMADILVSKLQPTQGSPLKAEWTEKETERFFKVVKALERCSELIKTRREILMSRPNPSSEKPQK
jgi:hypothetical protein